MYPPNIELIRVALRPPEQAIFCYGDTIYNPSKRKLTPDIEYHESIHSKQQGDTPDIWYAKYLTDNSFRLDQELEAYSKQREFIIDNGVSGKLLEWATNKMAEALSRDYKLDLNIAQAKSKIRNYGR